MPAIIPQSHETEQVNEGGYNWPLSEWRQYYNINVARMHAISHEQFVKEFPKVTEALIKSQELYEAEREDLNTVAQLAAAIRAAGGLAKVYPVLQEMMAMNNPQQPPMGVKPLATQQDPNANPMPGQQPAGQDTGQNANGLHAHKMFAQDGNGQTDDLAGHSHLIQGGKCLPGADGHVHEMPTDDPAAEQAEPDPNAQPVPNAIAQPKPPFKQGGN